jgi:asparagine synthetase B (glutamine-hydrolysing)
MANLIVICSPRASANAPAVDHARCAAAALAPDNIKPHAPLIYERDGLVVAVANPVAGIPVHDGCVCMGRMYRPSGRWWEMQSAAPDGSYVIVRHDERRLELLTDVLATRPLWYVQTAQRFLASTSQRALITLLGSFELDQESVTWMLTSGHLGTRSWDTRLRRLPGDSRLTLDLDSWDLRVKTRPLVREPLPLSDAEHVDRLREAIFATCASLDLPMDEWLLPLSGGLDSRALLLGLLHAGRRPRCVTWGATSSLADVHNDARIATELAAALGVEHRYYPVEYSATSLEVALQRFLAAGEGQVDQFGGYADGMGVWATFFEDGVAGVIRGDEPAMGYYTRYDSELQILRRWGITFLSEYPPNHPVRSLGLVEQTRDERFRRRSGESLVSWYARMFDEFCSPAMLAPLTPIKCAYVEVVNPLQSRRVAEVARALPDHLMIHRKPLHEMIHSLGPKIPVATEGALRGTGALVQTDSMVATVTGALASADAERVLSRPALDKIVAGLSGGPSAPQAGRGLKDAVKAVVPSRLVDRVRPVWPLRLSGPQLAFRAFIAVQMTDILTRDACALGKTPVV